MPATGTATALRLSAKPILVEDRLIVALDTPSAEAARALVDELGELVTFYKIGLELFMAGGYWELLAWLSARGKKTFIDLKLFDVPNTVGSAIRQLRGRGAQFVTVHGNDEMLAAACAEKGETKILAVTMLTSLDEADLKALGFQTSAADLVLSRAERALAIGCDGVISSGLEAARLRDHLGERLLIVVPGIRPVANSDDQKRTVDVEEAFANGADHIVVGRPITAAADRREAARAIQARIVKLFGG
jgi:orotidine-5'-phosphate decarboxylase